VTDQQLSLFDYTALDTETRIVVQQRTGEIKALMRTTAQGIIDIGEKLTEVKQRLGHGNFGTWLHLEFSWTDRTARQFMRVYDQFKMENFSDLTIAPSALYLLAAPSTPDEVREHFIEQSQNGISVGYTEVKELKQAFDIAPDPIKKRLLEGEIAPKTAKKLAEALNEVPVEVREIAIEGGVSDPDAIPLMARLYKEKRETFDTMAVSKTVNGEIPLEKATVRDIERHLEEAAKEHKQQATEARRVQIAEKIASIARNSQQLDPQGIGTFPVIYADPPWQYEHVETWDRAIENHYPTMELDAICNMPVKQLATDDAILFLWVTSPKVAEAIRVIEAWGFVYRTCMVWDKGQIGMGYYFRQQHELLFVAARGALPVPMTENRYPSVLHAPRGRHSEKPVEVYEIIESMYPEYRKIELFSRKAREGWFAWGNEVNGDDTQLPRSA
jgi:N6-adenosine-specific RNA methylase IME4